MAMASKAVTRVAEAIAYGGKLVPTIVPTIVHVRHQTLAPMQGTVCLRSDSRSSQSSQPQHAHASLMHRSAPIHRTAAATLPR